MRGRRFVPETFSPPRRLQLAGVDLRVLGVDDLHPDYEAVMESGAALNDLFHPGDQWPNGLTLRANMIDLAWHEKEFARRSSFAWGLWRAQTTRYLGSAYVYPDPDSETGAHAVHWIRVGETDAALRPAFKLAWEAYVRSWPLPAVRFSPV